MQYKNIVTTLLITMATAHSFAQQPAIVAKNPIPVTKIDTALKNKSASALQHTNGLLASNITNPTDKKGYNHVPLAGEKAYFGEKNEFVNDFVRKYLELHYNTLSNV